MLCDLSGAVSLNITDNTDFKNNLKNPSPPVKKYQTREGKKIGLTSCEEGLSWMCLKMELVHYIDRLSAQNEINILPGLEVIKNDVVEEKPAEIFAELARSYPHDPSSRLNGYIISKLTNYIQSHSLRLKLIDEEAISEARSIVATGRSKPGKKGGGMEALLAAGIAMKGTLMALALGALALMAGKALSAALMALVLSAIVAMKSMGGTKEVKYEIISKPIHTSSHNYEDYNHGNGHGQNAYAGYSRSFQLEKPNQ